MKVNIKLILSIFLISLLFTGCNNPDNIKETRWKRAKNPENDIVIGVAAPWKQLKNKTLYKKGITFALDEINAKGGVLGKSVNIIYRDDAASIEKGKEIAQDFAENMDMVAVIGHLDSHISRPASIIYQYYGLLMLSPASDSPEFAGREGYDLIFRNAPTDIHITEKAAEFCAEKGFKRVVIYGIDNEWGADIANTFEFRATELGINLVDYRTFNFTSDPHRLANDIKRWQDFFKFDALFLASDLTDAARFISEARKLGLTHPIIGGNRMDSPILLEHCGDAAQGVIVGSCFHPDMPEGSVRDFVKRFYEKNGMKPDSSAAQAYDTLNLLAAAMKKAGSAEPSKVADTIRSMKSWKGITGLQTFDRFGNVIDKPVIFKEVEADHFAYLKKK